MIEVTQRKLRETHFFFHRLLNESQKPAHSETDVFLFYLSAFLSAGRSVTLALQCEEPAKYNQWFGPWSAKLSPEDKDLCGFLKDQRNNVLYRGDADVIVGSEYVPASPLWTQHLAHTAYGFPLFGEEGFTAQVAIPVHFFQSCNRDQDVMDSCKQYLEILTMLVTDFLTEVGPPPCPVS